MTAASRGAAGDDKIQEPNDVPVDVYIRFVRSLFDDAHHRWSSAPVAIA